MSTKKYTSKHKRKNRGLHNIFPTPLLLGLGGLALVAAGLFAVWKSNQPQNPQVAIEVKGAPSLKVDHEKIDFGDVPLNQTVTATFQIANVGDEALRFSGKPYIEVVEGC